MSSDRAKTTWKELYDLSGWTKDKVLTTLSNTRPPTMSPFKEVALNESFADSYGWHSYNDFKGVGHLLAPSDLTTQSYDEGVWEYKNGGDTTFYDAWTEGWEDTERVDALVTTKAKVAIDGTVKVQGFFGTGFSFEFGADDTHPIFNQDAHTFHQRWSISVPPGKHYRLVRTRSVTTGTQEYCTAYGIADDSLVATIGSVYLKRSCYLHFNINYYLNPPSATMVITGTLTRTKYTFKLEEVHDDGKAGEVPIELPTSARFSRTGTGLTSEEVVKCYVRSVPDALDPEAIVGQT